MLIPDYCYKALTRPSFDCRQRVLSSHPLLALRSYEDLLGIATGGYDGLGHLGYAAERGLRETGSRQGRDDKPINRSTGGGVLANFTRLETFGARNTHRVSVRIDASNPNLFIIEPRIVPANTQ
jgi:hypothetical protein